MVKTKQKMRRKGGGKSQVPSSRRMVAPLAAVGLLVVVFALVMATRPPPSAPRALELQSPPSAGVHEHAPYEAVICGEKKPPIGNTMGAGGAVHTHGDSLIHVEPLTDAQGKQATVARLILAGGGLMQRDTLRYPGEEKTYRNGDLCPDGKPGFLRVLVNGQDSIFVSDTIPRDQKRVRIEFG